MSYIQGFLLAVPTANREAYTRVAEKAAAWFRKEGALEVIEAWEADVPDGKVNSMRSAVLLKEDESVVFSWIVWPDAPTSAAAMEKMMADPEFDPGSNPMPFDGQRMIYGGFTPIVDA